MCSLLQTWSLNQYYPKSFSNSEIQLINVFFGSFTKSQNLQKFCYCIRHQVISRRFPLIWSRGSGSTANRIHEISIGPILPLQISSHQMKLLNSKTLQYVLKYKQISTKVKQKGWPTTAIFAIIELMVLGMHNAV